MPTGPRPGRRPVNARISWAAVDAIDRLALDEGVVDDHGLPNRSEMIRLLLARGMRTWEKDWRP